MPIRLLPTLLLYILLVGYTPGPANMYSLSCSLRYGRKQALVMWRGLLVGFCIAVSVVAVCAHTIGTVLGDYVVWLKYPGAAYIMWLAYNIIKTSGQPTDSGRSCTFLSGMIVQLTNAKIILFDLMSFSMFVLPYSNRLSDLFAVAALLLLAGPGANLAWILLGDALRRFFERYRKQVDVVMAVALFACALFILFM